MPLFWSLPPIPVQDDGRRVVQVDGRLTVKASHVKARREDRKFEFNGNVEADYGVTRIYAQRLDVQLPIGDSPGVFIAKAIAEGDVRIVDPDGTLRAERFEFDWTTGNGTAVNATVQLAGLEVNAASIEIGPGEWMMREVRIATDRGDARFALRSLRVVPGDRMEAEKAKTNILGLSLGSLPAYRIALGVQGEATSIPEVGRSEDRGLSLDWKVAYPIAPNLGARARFSLAERRRPAITAQATYSFLPIGSAVVAPRSITGRPFSFGFMNSIKVDSLEDERKRLSAERLSATIGTGWNLGQGVEDREPFDRPFEVIFEAAKGVGAWALYGQWRWETIRTRTGTEASRSVAIASVLAPPISISPTLAAYIRIDARTHLDGNSSTHSWLRGEGGVSWTATDDLRISASYGEGLIDGERRFEFDEPRAMRSINFRVDTRFGPTTLSILQKYEPGGMDWYGQEIFLSHIAGSFEPYVIWREGSDGLSIGFLFRPIEELKKIQKRLRARTPGNQIPVPD